jgi:hypothetical protein
VKLNEEKMGHQTPGDGEVIIEQVPLLHAYTLLRLHFEEEPPQHTYKSVLERVKTYIGRIKILTNV